MSQIDKTKIRIPGINTVAKDELSCFGFPGMFRPGTINPFFTFKKYQVTFASLRDAATERLSMAKRGDKEFYKSSGLPKRPRADVRFKSIPLNQKDVEESNVTRLGEVVIDNWIVDTYYGHETGRQHAEMLGLKFVKLKDM